MCDTRYWTKEFLTDFISLYKSHPSLWKVKSKEYANKALKEQAYAELIAKCKSVYPQADRNFVFKKIQSVRGVFRKELRKIERSKQESSDPADLYVPTLWYFDQLLFTKDLETNRSSDYGGGDSNQYSDDGSLAQSPENNVEYEDDFVDDDGNVDEDDGDGNIDDVQLIEPEVTINESQGQIPTTYNRISNPRSAEVRFTPYDFNSRPNRYVSFQDRRTQATLANLNSSNLTITRTPTLSNEYEAFSINMAAKLQKMDELQRIHAESLISQVIYKGLLKQLDENTVLKKAIKEERNVKSEDNLDTNLESSLASSSTPNNNSLL